MVGKFAVLFVDHTDGVREWFEGKKASAGDSETSTCDSSLSNLRRQFPSPSKTYIHQVERLEADKSTNFGFNATCQDYSNSGSWLLYTDYNKKAELL